VPEKLVVKMLEELSIRTRVHEGREVPLSFTGISLVSWLVQTVKSIESREEAVKWGRAMLKQDLFFPADDGQPFADEHVPFVLNLDHPLVGPAWVRVSAAAAPAQLARRASSPSLPAPASPRRAGPAPAALPAAPAPPPQASNKPPRRPTKQPAPSSAYADDYK